MTYKEVGFSFGVEFRNEFFGIFAVFEPVQLGKKLKGLWLLEKHITVPKFLFILWAQIIDKMWLQGWIVGILFQYICRR